MKIIYFCVKYFDRLTELFFLLFSVLFPAIGDDPLICSTTERDIFQTGLCMRIADCPYYGGEGFGTCGGGMGTCCVCE